MNRDSQRTKMVVPVRVLVRDASGQTLSWLAHTLDANVFGTRLGGFHGELCAGDTVTVQYQHRRSSFRVVWAGKRGTPQGTQVGLKCLEPSKNIWNADQEDDQPGTAVVRSNSVFRLNWELR